MRGGLHRAGMRHKAMKEETAQSKKKIPDNEVIHGQTAEEVAMDTAGAERVTCSETEKRKASGGQKEIMRTVKKRRSVRRGTRGVTYAWLCAGVVPRLCVCSGCAAPTVGCRA